jgi:hypothetical protein
MPDREASNSERLEFLLRIYETERQDNQTAVQLMVALITAGIAYVVPLMGVIVQQCGPAVDHLFSSGRGCTEVNHWLIGLAPVPAVALYAFLMANQVTVEARCYYLEDLEREIERLAPDVRIEAPAGQRGIIGRAYHAPTSAVTAMLSQVGALLVVIAMLLGCAGLLPWAWPGFAMLLYLIALVPIVLTVIFQVLPLTQRKKALHRRAATSCEDGSASGDADRNAPPLSGPCCR